MFLIEMSLYHFLPIKSYSLASKIASYILYGVKSFQVLISSIFSQEFLIDSLS